MEETTNRQYKSSVFKDLFQNDVDGKENFLSLYNALHDTNYTLDEVTIEPEEIKQTLYHTYYNDVSMLVNGKLIVLMEHQSTINENMPLRFLDYVTRLYEKLVPDTSRFQKNLVHIPTPEFYVFYNGIAPYPEYKELKLSDAFIVPNEKLQLELKVDVYNINISSDTSNLKNLIITNKCAILNQYSQFVETVRKFYNGKDSSGFTQAIRECIDNGILKEYLKRNATEVSNLLVKEYRYEDDIAAQREEAFNMGREKGVEIGALKNALDNAKNFINEGISLEIISKCINLPLEELEKLSNDLQK